MALPFETSRRKIAWAEKRLEELYWELQRFQQREPYKKVIEDDPEHSSNVVHKMVLTEQIPDSTLNLAAEIVSSLRTALDNAMFDVALAGGETDPRSAAFPFAGTIKDMPKALGRCKDVPAPIHSLCCGLQPYQGGNDALWALNKLSNADKHRILHAFGTGVVRAGASLHGTGYFSMPDPHVWDSSKDEMLIIQLGRDTTYEYHFDFRIFVAFADETGLVGQNVLQTLAAVAASTQCAVDAIEGECHRLKYI
jgi:hypothetical protein